MVAAPTGPTALVVAALVMLCPIEPTRYAAVGRCSVRLSVRGGRMIRRRPISLVTGQPP